jgi:hypothetical protein
LWGLVSIHVVGGAVLFRRLFPRESPWFGFIVPGLAMVLLLNFVEHGVAIPSLRWLMPVTSIGFLWLIISPKTRWRFLRVPTFIFLLSFTLTLLLKCLKPDIEPVTDGILDLSLISNFCMGQTLPVDSTWVPPIKFLYYYGFPHYAASVLIRLFTLDMGTGFNVSAALLSAFIYFCAAAVAWRIGQHKMWITLLVILLVACATTGSTPYLWLTQKDYKDPDDAANLFNRTDVPQVPMPFESQLTRLTNFYCGHKLVVPGYWSWMGSYHSAMAGQFLTLFSVYSLTELVRRRRTNWPWICSAGVVLLMLVSSTWGVPLVGLFFLGGASWCASQRIAPRDWRFVVIGLGIMTMSLTPMLIYFLQSPTPLHDYLGKDDRTQLAEFLIQWWPIYLPWLALLFYWRKMHPAALIVYILFPVAFLATESYNFGARLDMTGKIWGFIFGSAWAVFIPTLAVIRSYFLRFILLLLVIASGLSLCFWIDYYSRAMPPDHPWELDGIGSIRADGKKARLLNITSTIKHQIIITGKSGWAFNQSPLLANLTLNSDYATWSFDCDVDVYPNSYGEAYKRQLELKDLYEGKNDDPLAYLRERNIAALVIWPYDNITDDMLAKLQQRLAPDYFYEDCRDGHPHVPPNTGVFLYRPHQVDDAPKVASPPPTPLIPL